MIYHHILVAYDGSKASIKALDMAARMAEAKPATKLTVIRVLYRPSFEVGLGAIPPAEYQEWIKAQEAAILEKAKLKTAQLPYASIVVQQGNPAMEILDYAHNNNCDLIVMGSRGLGAIREWFLGSVSHHVVQQARIPVLVVK